MEYLKLKLYPNSRKRQELTIFAIQSVLKLV